jgi:hypothetical protein
MYKATPQVYNFYDYANFIKKIKKTLVRVNVTNFRYRSSYNSLLPSHVKVSQTEALTVQQMSPLMPSAPAPTPILLPRTLYVLPPPLQAFNAQQKLSQTKRKITKTNPNNGKEVFFDTNSKVALPLVDHKNNTKGERLCNTNKSQRIEPIRRIQPQLKRSLPAKLGYLAKF